MRDKKSIATALADEKYDYILLKGARQSAFMTSLEEYKSFVRHLHEQHTKPGTVFLLSFTLGQEMVHDGEAAYMLEELGYENLTFEKEYFDEEIRTIRISYPYPERETAAILGPPETTDLGIPQHKKIPVINILTCAGDFEFLRRRK